MAETPNDFDLSAAWLRRAQTDVRAFMEAFAVRLESAMPDLVKVERRKDGLFSKLSHVASVTIDAESNKYILALEKSLLSARRTKIVRGVSLRTEMMEIPEWLAALQSDVQRLAGKAGDAQNVLHDFLMS